MQGLMFRLNNTAIVADADGGCSALFCKLIDSELGIAGIRGSAELVSGIRMGIQRYRVAEWEDSYLMRLPIPPACAPHTIALARQASMRDLDMLAQLYQDAGGMYRSRANVAAKLAESRVFVVEEPALGRRAKRIASCALLSPEGSDAGLIGGVYTTPAARNKGYAAACVSALSLDVQRDGKLPVLFYENPVAGALYRKLGFEECGRWGVLYLGSAPDRR
jgi:GNAT superfamily N-acetyltransferase